MKLFKKQVIQNKHKDKHNIRNQRKQETKEGKFKKEKMEENILCKTM